MLHKTTYLKSSNDIIVCKDKQDFDFDTFSQKKYLLKPLKEIKSFSEVVRADTEKELQKLIQLKNKLAKRKLHFELIEL